jgi:Mn2+/Fe2+ NRAMP family transporter
VPNVPDTGSVKQTFLVIASMVGTSVFSGVFLLRGILVKEAGWTWTDYKVQRRDALVSAGMVFLVSASVMAAAAGTLHAKGIKLENVTEMMGILEPLAGLLAVGIFTIGIAAAGVSTQLPVLSLTPLLIEDYKERKPNLKRLDYRIYALYLTLLGLVLPVFHVRPVIIMVASQAFSAVILPVTVACLIYLGNKENVMGDKKYSLAVNLQLALVMIFSLIMSYMGYSGLIDFIRNI